MGTARDIGATINSYLPSWSTFNRDAQLVNNTIAPPDVLGGATDFLTGLVTGKPTQAPSVTVALPAARTAPNPANLGTLSPAAQAILGVAAASNPPAAGAPAAKGGAQAPAANGSTQAPAANGNAPQIDPALAKALGGLSFRQLVSLGDVVEKTRPSPSMNRPLNPAEALTAYSMQQYANSLAAAGNDKNKQKVAGDAFRDSLIKYIPEGLTAGLQNNDGTPTG